MIHKFKEGRPKTWNEFCLRVHLRASRNRVDSLVPQRQLVHLGIGTGELYNVQLEIGNSHDVIE
jgi:hypothetical protein